MNDWNPADDLRLEDTREPEFVDAEEEPADDVEEFEYDEEWDDDDDGHP